MPQLLLRWNFESRMILHLDDFQYLLVISLYWWMIYLLVLLSLLD